MYCALDDAYGSSISGINESFYNNSNHSEQSNSFDSQSHDESENGNKNNHIPLMDENHGKKKERREKRYRSDHRFYIEQFESMKNATINVIHKNNKISLFNETFDHINNCDSCKLYLKKNSEKQQDRSDTQFQPNNYFQKRKDHEHDNNVLDAKELFLPLLLGFLMIIIIKIIVRISLQQAA
jgi:hypothetical protein